ncbi:hypothetical protein I7I48_01817 [Histoplasma ohiense]|nr:hypothetical protein I7I48_01817 [Histoplasma ohiense (nom. inval.)]
MLAELEDACSSCSQDFIQGCTALPSTDNSQTKRRLQTNSTTVTLFTCNPRHFYLREQECSRACYRAI